MSGKAQKFCPSYAKDSTWTPGGLREFFEYRDLGISDATDGQSNAHVIRVMKPVGEFPHTGPHTHELDFQIFFVLNGWIKLIYEGHGEHTRPAIFVCSRQGLFTTRLSARKILN